MARPRPSGLGRSNLAHAAHMADGLRVSDTAEDVRAQVPQS